VAARKLKTQRAKNLERRTPRSIAATRVSAASPASPRGGAANERNNSQQQAYSHPMPSNRSAHPIAPSSTISISGSAYAFA